MIEIGMLADTIFPSKSLFLFQNLVKILKLCVQEGLDSIRMSFLVRFPSLSCKARYLAELYERDGKGCIQLLRPTIQN